MSYAPVVTTYANRNPAPRAEVLFPDLAPAAVKATVWREAGGRSFRVRGAVNASVAGAFSRIDNEIPFNTPVTYWAEMFDSAGASLGLTDKSTVTLWCTDTWVHHPLDPANAITVAFRDDALRAISRPTMGDVHYPMGRKVGVVISGDRRGFSGAVLNIVVDTVEDADTFTRMLGDYTTSRVPVLCFRNGEANKVRLPSPFFAAVLDAVEVDVDVFTGHGSTIAYEMKADEAAPPAEGILVPLLTRADIAAYYQTRQAVADDNETRLSLSRRYDLAGTA